MFFKKSKGPFTFSCFFSKAKLPQKTRFQNKNIFSISPSKKLGFKTLSQIPEEKAWLAIKERRIELVPGNEENILTFLSFVGKRRIVQRIPHETLDPILSFLLDQADTLSPSQLGAFSGILQKTSPSDEVLWKRLEEAVLRRAPQLPVRCLANIVFAFGEAQKNQEKVVDHFKLFRELETILTIHFARNDFHEKDLLGVVLAYSRTNSASNEFLEVLYKICLEKGPSFSPSALIPMLYSLTLNGQDQGRKLLGLALNKFFEKPETFKQKEISILFSVLYPSDMKLEPGSLAFLDKFLHEISVRLGSTNIQDLTLLTSTLTGIIENLKTNQDSSQKIIDEQLELGFDKKKPKIEEFQSKKKKAKYERAEPEITKKNSEYREEKSIQEAQNNKLKEVFRTFVAPAWSSLHLNCDLRGLSRMFKSIGWLVSLDEEWAREHTSLLKKVLKHYAQKQEKRGVFFDEIAESISLILNEKVRHSFERAMEKKVQRHKGPDTFMKSKEFK